MSKGPGKLQRVVLGLVDARGPLPISTIVWETATAIGVGQDDDIRGEVYNNTVRAARSLTVGAEARLVRNSRIFLKLDELIQWYPDRTKSATVRKLRQQLLPHLRGYLNEVPPRKEVATEAWVLGGADSPHYATLASRWPRLEPLLLRELGSSSDPNAVTLMLRLLVRAREILSVDRSILCSASLIVSVARLRRHLGQSGSSLQQELDDLFTQLPVHNYRQGRLKAELQRAVIYRRHGRPTLDPRFQHYLLEREPALLCGLPGHRERHPRKGQWWGQPEVTYSAQLDELFDHTAFKAFDLYASPTK